MEGNKSCVFNNEPQYMKSLIGKSVEVKTTDNAIHRGIVYALDPESKTLALVTQQQPKQSLALIMCHSITSLQPTDKYPNEDLSFSDVLGKLDDEELVNKRTRLKKWLEDNLIELQEDGMILKIDNLLQIEPPYNIEQCVCNNTMVLDQIRSIIQRMPDNYNRY